MTEGAAVPQITTMTTMTDVIHTDAEKEEAAVVCRLPLPSRKAEKFFQK